MLKLAALAFPDATSVKLTVPVRLPAVAKRGHVDHQVGDAAGAGCRRPAAAHVAKCQHAARRGRLRGLVLNAAVHARRCAGGESHRDGGAPAAMFPAGDLLTV